MYVVLLNKSKENIKYVIGCTKNTTNKYFVKIFINLCSTGAGSRPRGICFSNISEMDRDRAAMFQEFFNAHVLFMEI